MKVVCVFSSSTLVIFLIFSGGQLVFHISNLKIRFGVYPLPVTQLSQVSLQPFFSVVTQRSSLLL